MTKTNQTNKEENLNTHKNHKEKVNTDKELKNDFFETLAQTTATIKEFLDNNPDNIYFEKINSLLDVLNKIQSIAPNLLMDINVRKLINEKLEALDLELLNEIKRMDSSNVESILHKITLDGSLFNTIEQIYTSVIDTIDNTLSVPKNKTKAKNIFFKLIRVFNIFSRFSKSPLYKMIFGENPLDNLTTSHARLHKKYAFITGFYNLLSLALFGKLIFVFYMMFLKNTPITTQTITYLIPIILLLLYVIYLAKVNSKRKIYYEKLRATFVDSLKYLDTLEVAYKKGHKDTNLEAIKVAIYNKKLDLIQQLVDKSLEK
jgi:hypothetical protein